MRNTMNEIGRIYDEVATSAEQSHQQKSVAEKRLLFENLSLQMTNNSNNNNDNMNATTTATAMPPPKPKRTFAQDHYFSLSNVVVNGNGSVSNNLQNSIQIQPQKINNNNNNIQIRQQKVNNSKLVSVGSQQQESRPKLIVCRPLVKPNRSSVKKSDAPNDKTGDEKLSRQGLTTPKRPKYFQLSHEYEQIFSVDRRPSSATYSQTGGLRQRSASLENVYATPSHKNSVNSCFNDSPSTSANAPPSLYYCSAPIPVGVPVPPPRFKRKDNSSCSNNYSKDFTTPLTSKTTTTKLKLSIRNAVNTFRETKLSPPSGVSLRADPPVNGGGHPASKFYHQDSNNNNNSNHSDDQDEQEVSRTDGEDDTTSTCSSTRDNEVERRVQRARVVRRQTLIHYDQQEMAFKSRKLPQLFELAVVVELRPNDHSNPLYAWKFVPTISYQYPPHVNVSLKPLIASLPFLCYPDVSRATPKLAKDYVDELFVVTVTDQTGDRKFAYCCRYVPALHSSNFVIDPLRSSPALKNYLSTMEDPLLPTLPQVLCVLTPVQAVQFYTDFVKEGALRAKTNRVALNEFLRLSFNRPLPPAGGRLMIAGAGLVKDVAITNRASSSRAHGLGSLVERLRIDHTLLLFASLLSERRVLIVGDNVPAVSKVVQASAAMLAPFEWPHTLIPVVPDSYVQLCFSPTPYLIGVLRSNLHELKHLLVGSSSQSSDDDDEDYILIYDLDYGVLKDRDSNVPSTGSASTHESYRFLPTKVARMLRQTLKAASTTLSSSTPGGVAGSVASTPSAFDARASECFLLAFVELVGHYGEFIVTQQDGVSTFQKQNFIQYVSSKSHKMFLKWFVETGMFQIWMRKRLEAASANNLHNAGASVINANANNIHDNSNINDVFDRKIAELKNNTSGIDLFGAVAKRWASFLRQKR